MQTNTPKSIARARAALVLDHPFFATLALQIPADFDPTCETCWTDGKQVGINPEWWEKLDLQDQSHALAHLALHCGLEHHIRRGSRSEKAWNDAADYPTNRILQDAGFQIPTGGYMAPKGCEKIAEEWYQTPPEEDNQSPNGAGGAQSQQPQGEVRDLPGSGQNGKATKAERQQEGQKQRQKLTEAANVAKSAGSLPASLERLIESVLKPSVDWRDVLHEFAGTWAREDYSWSRPNARFLDDGLYLPSMHSETLGNIVIGIDTSGSIQQRDLDKFAGELSGILEDFGGMTATVIYCDAKVHPEATQTFTPDDLPIELKPHGGGGTRFSPLFAEVERLGLEPRALVYFTDLWCHDYPEQQPAYPVLWAKWDAGHGSGNAPPWGRVVELKPSEVAK